MNKFNLYLGIFLVALLSFTACSDDDNNDATFTTDPIEQVTESGAENFVFQGYENPVLGYEYLIPKDFKDALYLEKNNLQGNNYSFQASAAQRLDGMGEPAFDGDWTQVIPVEESKAYWVRHREGAMYNYLKLRFIQIVGNSVLVEYKVTDITSELPVEKNANANEPVDGKNWVTDLCIPHLNAELYYVEHTVKVNNAEVLNYAYEWDNSKKHSAWVAFYFDATTRGGNLTGSKNFVADPSLPANMQVDNSYHTNDGFDRGHLVGSADRKYTTEANDQTYYFSNMSPMFNSFNGGYWATFENQVRNWATSNKFDKMYITKGGAINKLLKNYTGTKAGQDGKTPITDANGFTTKGLACPQYYYMAILAVKNDAYQAIGFWTEHRDDYGYAYGSSQAPVSVMKDTAKSIDELEELTGLDFFCNLPDGVENEVEKSFSLDAWTW